MNAACAVFPAGKRWRGFVFALALAVSSGSETCQGANPQGKVMRVDPPRFGFYTKTLNCGGIPVRSAEVVDDRALILACDKIDRMLVHLPIARLNLSARGAELHIIGRDQRTSDLPEFAGERGQPYVDNVTGKPTDLDRRTRGLGGLYSSCGEENLLDLPQDRYRGGSDICTHEFSHDLMEFGLDAGVRAKIEKQYRLSTGAGLWKGHYAALNAEEYFAELSMWYFGAHGEFVAMNFPAPGAAGLRSYDAGGFAVLDAIYSGREASTLIRLVRAPEADGRARSGKGNPSRLMVVNNTAQPIDVFWVDYEGGVRSYGKISAYAQRFFQTFSSHVWLFQDVSGRPIGRYRAGALECEVVFGP